MRIIFYAPYRKNNLNVYTAEKQLDRQLCLQIYIVQIRPTRSGMIFG